MAVAAANLVSIDRDDDRKHELPLRIAEDTIERIAAAVAARLASRPTEWPRWMPIKLAAAYIGHSTRSFEYLLSKDLFPVVRRDRLVLLDRHDLDRVLEKLKQ